MSAPGAVEAIELLPNRLSVAEFSPVEIDKIVGGDIGAKFASVEDFNWVAAYLVEEVGYQEDEVVEWFRSSHRGLGGHTPLGIWQQEGAVQEILDYAQKQKQALDEYLAEDDARHGTPNLKPWSKSHEIARYALNIIYKGFDSAGVDIRAGCLNTDEEQNEIIHNPDNPAAPIARWRGRGDMEEYRITLKDGKRTLMYYIVQHLELGKRSQILQTGVVGALEGKTEDRPTGDSDLDGRPPTAADVAPFVLGLANETRNRSLQPMAQAA